MPDPIHILFVCTGNICRSPMAEGLFRQLTAGSGRFTVSSAGLGAMQGQRPSDHAVTVMRELGIDISAYRSTPLDSALVAKAHCIFVMTRSHLNAVNLLFPEAVEKTYLLREFDDAPNGLRDVPDPIGQGLDAYVRCRDTIRQALPSVLTFLENQYPPKAMTVSASATSAPLSIAVAADHGGVHLRAALVDHLRRLGHVINDLGTFDEGSVDYPDYAAALCHEVIAGRARFGLLVCTTGIGMSIAANRFPQIRAALVHDEETTRLARRHNDANVLCLAGRDTSPELAIRLAEVFLSTPAEGGRHLRRVGKLCRLGGGTLAETDPAVFAAIESEERRQAEHIELIASENFTSRAVREAQGSCLTNKYAEGYPGRRWYGGCEHVDIIEQLAIDRVKQLFPGSEHANVQPHSGSQANAAVYFSVLEPGDRILTMNLAHGGHLTHGHKANFSGRFYQVTHYGVSATDERIDYDALAALAAEVKPRMITAGASAYPRIIDFERMRQIADSIGAYLFVDMAHIAGLVAGGQHPSPCGVADFVTTTTHKSLRGPRGGVILCRAKYAKAIDAQVFPGVQGGPLEHVIAAKAVCFQEALQPAFREYAAQIVANAKRLAGRLAQNGWRLVSGGTDNHLLLVDLRPRGLNGKVAQETLDQAGITVNKNGIPFDTEKITLGGGIRIGTPAVTTRGMREPEMDLIADLIDEALTHVGDAGVLERVRAKVRELTARFPLP